MYELPDIQTIKSQTSAEIAKLDKTIKRLVNPHIYPVGLEKSLYELRTDLVLKMKKSNGIK